MNEDSSRGFQKWGKKSCVRAPRRVWIIHPEMLLLLLLPALCVVALARAAPSPLATEQLDMGVVSYIFVLIFLPTTHTCSPFRGCRIPPNDLPQRACALALLLSIYF